MAEFITPSQVFLDVPVADVDAALAFIAAKAAELGITDDEQAVLAGLKAREADGSTGMQAGFAIPHCKNAAVKDASVIVVKFADDVDWKSMDGAPINMAISLLVPDSEAGTTFLKMLSKVAVMLMDNEFRTAILATEDPAEMAAIVNGRMED